MARYRLTESRLRGMIREAIKSALYENTGAWANKVNAFVNGLKSGNVEYIDKQTIGVPLYSYNDLDNTEMVTYCIGKPVLYDEYSTPTTFNLDDNTFKYIDNLSRTYYQALTTNFKSSPDNVMPYGYGLHSAGAINREMEHNYLDDNYGSNYGKKTKNPNSNYQMDASLPQWMYDNGFFY